MANTNTNQPNSSNLLSLPPELRLNIYHHLFHRPTPRPSTFTISNANTIHAFSIPSVSHERAACLLRTCKQLNAEATDLFYSSIAFTLSIFGPDQPALPAQVDYGRVDACGTLRRLRRVRIALHVNGERDITTILSHLDGALAQLEPGQKLDSCAVGLVLYWSPGGRDAEVALTVVQRILALEQRRAGLSVVECQVYSQLWREAMRVSSRRLLGYASYVKFRRFLDSVAAGEEREVGSAGKVYDLRNGSK